MTIRTRPLPVGHAEAKDLHVDLDREARSNQVAMNHFVDCPHGKDWSRK